MTNPHFGRPSPAFISFIPPATQAILTARSLYICYVSQYHVIMYHRIQFSVTSVTREATTELIAPCYFERLMPDNLIQYLNLPSQKPIKREYITSFQRVLIFPLK